MGSIERKYQSGEVIIQEGHQGNAFYVIHLGRVEVLKRKASREVQLSVLGPGEFFGEVSQLDPDKNVHSATVRALEDTTVTVMDHEDFEKYLTSLSPGMRSLLHQLAHRLRETSRMADATGRGSAGKSGEMTEDLDRLIREQTDGHRPAQEKPGR
jgi:CRP/FNR family transcriptional regulator, cyclic AMP receptor protein